MKKGNFLTTLVAVLGWMAVTALGTYVAYREGESAGYDRCLDDLGELDAAGADADDEDEEDDEI